MMGARSFEPNRYNFIWQAAQEAGQLLISFCRQELTVRAKGQDPRDLVTDADLAVNDFLTHKIKRAFPDEKIYSEEAAGHVPTGSFWALDPIDGTANFARGIPHFAVALAYVRNQQPVVGAVYNPATKELFGFENNRGVFLNDEPIMVSTIANLSEAYALLHIGRRAKLWDWGLQLQRHLFQSAKKTLNLGSSALDLCYLAAGRVDAVIYGTLTTLDIAAALGLVRAAGGEVYDLTGQPAALKAEPQPIIAVANSNLFGEIKAAVDFPISL